MTTKDTQQMSKDPRSHNVGKSDYSQHKIQPWAIWLDWELDPWRADIIKRVLRNKEGEDPILDLQKIIHICEELIRQEQETIPPKELLWDCRLEGQLGIGVSCSYFADGTEKCLNADECKEQYIKEEIKNED